MADKDKSTTGVLDSYYAERDSREIYKSALDKEETRTEKNLVEADIAKRRRDNQYQKASLLEKKKMIQAEKEELELAQKRTANFKEQLKLQELINEKTERYEKLNKAIAEADKKKLGFAEKQAKLQEKLQNYSSKLDQLRAEKSAGLITEEEFNKQKKAAASEFGVSEGLGNLFNKFLGGGSSVVKAINSAASTIAGATDKAVNAAIDTYTKGLSKVDTRLQGFNKRGEIYGSYWKEMSSNITTAIGFSPYISQKSLLENVIKVTDSGIAYNVEQRAYIATLSEKIATTFDALDQNLTRLIRIQQADMTTSQLGAEADLTNFFNNQFQDTSYLNQIYDSVQGAIIDATSQLSRDEATAFNYNVQKWLGSLYALGASDSLINSIAQGINYLGTGNVSAFNSNEGLRNLFAMSANRAGMSFSDILTSGLNAGTTNDLLRAMVMYLQEIAGSGNQVVKSAYGGVMGINSLSDLRAVRNLSASDIASIYDTNMSYNQAMTIANAGIMNGVAARTHFSEMYDNVINNALFGWGQNLVGNKTSYLFWKTADLLGDTVGGGKGGFLSGVLDKVSNLIKGVTGAISLIDYINDEALADLDRNSFSPLTASILNWSEYTSRGGNYLDTIAGIPTTGISYSGYTSYGNASGATAYNLMKQANAVTATSQSIQGTDWVITRSVGDLYSELFEKQTTPIKVNLVAVGEEAAEKLDGALMGKSGYEQLVSIRNRLDNEFDVDIKDNDVNAITSAISTMRAW